MPQLRQRIVFCDCLDCREQPPATTATSLSPANEAAARQEPPPKCLLICAAGCLLPAPSSSASSGAVSTSLEASSVPHLHKAARDGNLTLLALREQALQPGGTAAGSDDELGELEQLLGLHQAHSKENGVEQGTCKDNVPTIADRFKGMQATFSSNSQHACQLATEAGMAIASILAPDSDDDDHDTEAFSSFAGRAGTSDSQTPQLQLPSPPEAARRMLEQLDLASSHAGVDMVMVHVDAATAAATQQFTALDTEASSSSTGAYDTAVQVLQWVDRTLRYLNNSTALQETVLLTVVLTPAGACLSAPLPDTAWLQPGGTVLQHGGDVARTISRTMPRVLRPQQSFQVAAEAYVAVDMQRPMLCLRRLPGVVRRDGAERLSLAQWAATGGQQALLAERLLPELAYKVGRAPKYGA